jgi:hypothetical protein
MAALPATTRPPRRTRAHQMNQAVRTNLIKVGYEIAWVTAALRDLRVRDDAWARMDPAHRDAHRRL